MFIGCFSTLSSLDTVARSGPCETRNRGSPVAGFGQQHLNVADDAFRKSPFAITKIEFPHPEKFLGVAQPEYLFPVPVKIVAPGSQRRDIMGTNVLQMEQAHISGPGDGPMAVMEGMQLPGKMYRWMKSTERLAASYR